jgi:hypothetical protein
MLRKVPEMDNPLGEDLHPAVMQASQKGTAALAHKLVRTESIEEQKFEYRGSPPALGKRPGIPTAGFA